MEPAASDLVGQAFEQAVVRVRDGGGRTVGTGFLVADDLVCTCAHVVANAAGTDARAAAPPSADITIDFPLSGQVFSTTAQVVEWTPINQDETGDIAVLRVAATPPGARPAPLAPECGDWNETVRVLGFPNRFEGGVWKSGRLRSRQATGWVQIEIAGVAAGFSGSAVWGDAAGGVIGVAVGRQGSDIAYMIPLRSALSEHVLLRQPCPYRGLEPFREQDAPLFHGRAEEAARLVERMAHRQIVVVTGRSGCGKSSLVRATLFPALRAEGVTLIELPRMVPDDVELPADQDPVVVFADQFEEVEPARARVLFERFRQWAEEAPTRPGRPPSRRVVLTLRTAAIDDIFTAQDAELLDRGGVQVLPMGPDELLEAIVAPAKPRRLEDGLPERIMRDARDAPGQLPLLQFALTRLWDKGLTHSTYEAIGRVTGALADYANDVYEHRLRTARDQAVARKLLVRLARPTGSSFTLAPARLADLDPELRAMAEELSTHRLVVLERDEIVSLAHEALIHEWPALHDWLVADREFLAWRHRLHANMELWRENPNDSGRLLRGGPLTDAEARASARGDELSTEEHHYIRLSRLTARRGVRLRRTAMMLIALLAVVATVLAVVYVKRSEELAANARLQAGTLLAAESMKLANSGPVSSLQLAQAAHRFNPGSADTQSAMMIQMARFDQMRSLRTGLWSEPIVQAATSGDGGVVALAGLSGKITVWRGLNSADEPEPWEVSTSPKLLDLVLSEDGSTLGVVSELSGVEVWHVADRSGPVQLRKPEARTDARPTTVRSARFSPDGGRLVLALEPNHEHLANAHPDFIEVYDTRAAKAVPNSIAPEGVVDISVERVDPSGQVWLTEYDRPGNSRNVVRDLSGALVRELPNGFVTSKGVIVNCLRRSVITVTDGTTGTTRFTRRVPKCSDSERPLDSTGQFVLTTNGLGKDTFQLLTIVELTSGETFQVQWLMSDDSGQSGSGAVIIDREGDDVVMHVIGSGGVMRSQPLPQKADAMAFTTEGDSIGITQGSAQLSSDGKLFAARLKYDNNVEELALWELPGQKELGRVPLKLGPTPNLAFTADHRHLLAEGPDQDVLVLSVPELKVERKIVPPVPTEIGPPTAVLGWNMSILVTGNDDVVVLYAGTFSHWRISSGDRVGEVTPLRRNDPKRLREEGRRSQATRRPGHDSQVYVATSTGVLLFDLDQGKILLEHSPTGFHLKGAQVDPYTSRIAVQTEDNYFSLWNPDDDTAVRQSLPTKYDIVQFTPDGLLIFESEDRLEFWDPKLQRTTGTLNPPGTHSGWYVVDSSLLSPTNHGLVTLNLDRGTWMNTLCSLSNRDYTPKELEFVTSIHAERTPPCR
jgi:hypothetical protein